jgi:hypothetical protein
MSKGHSFGRAGWPSKNGNPSGKGRDNNTPSGGAAGGFINQDPDMDIVTEMWLKEATQKHTIALALIELELEQLQIAIIKLTQHIDPEAEISASIELVEARRKLRKEIGEKSAQVASGTALIHRIKDFSEYAMLSHSEVLHMENNMKSIIRKLEISHEIVDPAHAEYREKALTVFKNKEEGA